MTRKILPPIHPGEILLEEFLLPLGVSLCGWGGLRGQVIS